MAVWRKTSSTSQVLVRIVIVIVSTGLTTGAPNRHNFDLIFAKHRAKKSEGSSTVPDYVIKFAPELRFDRAAQGYPMSAQPFYDAMLKDSSSSFRLENTDQSTIQNGDSPTYYRVQIDGKQTRIVYWWFYGYQHPCWEDQGTHNGDWEHVMVILTEDMSAVAAVSFYQHNGHYTRIAGPRDAPCTQPLGGRCSEYGFESSGTHPIVYSGKIAHGSYHNPNDISVGSADQCMYYADYRNPKSSDDYMETWRKLISLDRNDEPWIEADRTGSFVWGYDGVSTHPTQHFPFDSEHSVACQGSATQGIASGGCYQSECLSGDDETAFQCLKECKPGYTNFGLTCNKGGMPWDWSIYDRTTGDDQYSYDYTLPKSDVGLSRRRSDISEWDLP